MQRRVAATQPTPDPQCGNIADMVGMEVTGENLVQLGVIDLEARKPVGGAGAQIKQERITVAQLNQKGGGDITG